MKPRNIGILFCAASALCFAGDTPVDRMEAVTVRVIATRGNEVSAGSGFIVGDGSYVVTNHHVIAGSREILVLGKSLRIEVDRVIADSATKDLAILRLSRNSGRPTAVLVMRSGVTKTENVLAGGFPGVGEGPNSAREDLLDVKFSKGIISAFAGNGKTRLYQTDAAVNPGNSGGPLFDECGRVVGINTMKAVGTTVVVSPDGQPTSEKVLYGEGVAWAVQADELAELMRSNGMEPRAQSNTCTGAVLTGHSADSYADSLNPKTRGKSGPNWLLVTGLAVGVITLLGAIGYGVMRRRNATDAMPAPSFVPPMPAPLPPFLHPQARVRCLSGTHSGLDFSVSIEPIVLGRDPRVSQIVFEPEDNMVSKRHCSLRFDPTSRSMWVDDLGSTNGTFLENGERLRPGAGRQLPVNSRFYLGDRDHLFEVREEMQ